MNKVCYGFALAINTVSGSPQGGTLRFARLVDAGLINAVNDGRVAEYKHDLLDMIVEAIEDNRADRAAILAFALAGLA